jgi:tRNA(Ile)-lysidine synthase
MAQLGLFEPCPRLAVAVSGGPDSMALALLAANWARPRRGTALGLVVDHGLRPESAGEAARTCSWLAKHGLAVRLLTWAGAKPTSGIQVAARAARLALLLDACRAETVLHLLLAHQREDQAETVALRQAAGSGPGGLAGIAAVREVDGLRLLRPLLAVPKARLIATLAAASQPWFVDPANASPQFARGRLRRDPDFAPEAAWARGSVAAARRTADDAVAATALARLARPDRLGLVRVDAATWTMLDPADRAALLGRLLAAVGGRAYPVAGAALGRLAAGDVAAPATLGGCIIVRRGADLLVCREPGRIRHRLHLSPGASARWDGRFAVRYERGPEAVEIRALGREGLTLLDDTVRRRLRTERAPAHAVHALPAAWVGSTLVACPLLDPYGLNSSRNFSIIAVLNPHLPPAAAPFAGVNVVSFPQQPIYRLATARVLIDGPASAVSSVEPPRPTSRRTQ